MSNAYKQMQKRRARVRNSLRRKARGRVRLSVFRSGRHIYAQVIDDAAGATVASASTVEKAVKDGDQKSWGRDAAAEVGKLIAERAKEKGVEEVVFDRGGYLFHGRVKALADGAREGGLSF